MKRFARQEDKPIVVIPLVVWPTVVVIEPRLTIVISIDIEEFQVAVTVGNLYKIPSVPPPLENSIIISRLNII